MKHAQRRKAFLKIFLGALGAIDLVWGEVYSDKLYGTVLYDADDKDERQNFVWYMTEQHVPSQEVNELICYLTQHKLLEVDRLSKPLNEIAAEVLKPGKREKAIHNLLAVEVRMLDDGAETDSYFMHE